MPGFRARQKRFGGLGIGGEGFGGRGLNRGTWRLLRPFRLKSL